MKGSFVDIDRSGARIEVTAAEPDFGINLNVRLTGPVEMTEETWNKVKSQVDELIKVHS